MNTTTNSMDPGSSLRRSARDDNLAWYRHRWPWLLISGPAIVVVAGFYTLFLALQSNDGLVAEDYYKQGLAIDRVIAREERAAVLGLSAALRYDANRDVVRVTLAPAPLAPAKLTLRVVHPTRAGSDQVVELSNTGGGVFEGPLAEPPMVARSLILEDAAGNWRLAGEWAARSLQASLVAHAAGGP